MIIIKVLFAAVLITILRDNALPDQLLMSLIFYTVRKKGIVKEAYIKLLKSLRLSY